MMVRLINVDSPKIDDLILNNDWLYMIKNNGFFFETLLQASKVPLEHMFNNNDNFSA